MIDKVRDTVDEVSNRLKSPFFYSYLISWLLVNWKVSLYLLWPKKIFEPINGDGFEFIRSEITILSFLYPIGGAILYTLLAPLVRNAVNAFNVYMNKKGSEWVFKISKDASVSFDKYLKLRAALKNRTKALSDALNQEEDLFNQLEDVKTRLVQVESKNSELENRKTELEQNQREMTDATFIDGLWKLTYTDEFNKVLKGMEILEIRDGKYFVYDKGTENDLEKYQKDFKSYPKMEVFLIEEFYFIKKDAKLVFVKNRLSMNEQFKYENKISYLKYNLNLLHIEGRNIMRGYENSTTKVIYERVIDN